MLYDLTTGKESGELAHPLGPNMEMMGGRANSPVDRWLAQWSSDVERLELASLPSSSKPTLLYQIRSSRRSDRNTYGLCG